MSWQLTVAIMLIITGGAAVYVSWPLLMGRTEPEEYLGGEPSEPVIQRLMFQRDATYAAMKELEFDRAMGNLSQEDFDQLQERYKRKAVAILKWIDDARAGRLPAGAVLDDDEALLDEERPAPPPRRGPRGGQAAVDLDVEQEIQAYRRQSRGSGAAQAGPAAPARTAGAGLLTCPSCGRPVKDRESAFCNRCGAPLRARGKKTNRVKGD